MLDIFFVQFLAAGMGAASTGLADWLYNSGRIRQGLHSFWVAASIAVICLPVLIWTTAVFLGSGTFSQLVAGALVSAIFFWVHQKLRKLPSPEDAAHALPPSRPSTGTVPPASKLNS